MKKIMSILMSLVFIFSITGCANNNGNNNKENLNYERQNNLSNANIVTENNNSLLEDNEISNNITVYLSGSQEMIDKLEKAYEEEKGDLLDMIVMSCGQLRNKVWVEKEAGNIQADVIWGSDPILYNKLDDLDLLDELDIEDIESINEKYIVNDRNYAYVNERYITIIYNKNEVENIPKEFDDLINAEYKNNIVMADATQSATAFAIASSIYQLFGGSTDYFKLLKQNGMMLSQSNGKVPSMIMEGQYIAGIGPHDSVIRLKNKGEKQDFEVPLEIAWPSEGVISLIRPVGIPTSVIRSEVEQNISMDFINFLLSEKAQKITYNFGFVSVRDDIENEYLPENIEVNSINWDEATENEEELMEKYEEIFQK